MTATWARWRALWEGDDDPLPLVLVRVVLPLVFLWDFWQVHQLHLVIPLWGPGDAGGMGDPEHRTAVPLLYQWFAPTVATTRGAFWVLCASTMAVSLGLCLPLSSLATVLVYAQFAQVLPAADRGIDTFFRDVLLILAFSGASRRWGIDALLFGRRERIAAWPRRLLILQVVGLYFMAGVQKAGVAWWPWGGFSALFIVLQDMAVARHAFDWLQRYYPLTQLLTGATMAFELGACLVPYAYWSRHTRERPGWLRAQFNRLDIVPGWLLLGVGMHLGIAATMRLGVFPFAMLATYPAFFHGQEIRRVLGRLTVADARPWW
ncbi:MAG: HTTM domain-containing protein [Deltaproteobacteria bacterium]|nr:HTTM domain-containing protein [Deltaproteobacteria bacterium]